MSITHSKNTCVCVKVQETNLFLLHLEYKSVMTCSSVIAICEAAASFLLIYLSSYHVITDALFRSAICEDLREYEHVTDVLTDYTYTFCRIIFNMNTLLRR